MAKNGKKSHCATAEAILGCKFGEVIPPKQTPVTVPDSNAKRRIEVPWSGGRGVFLAGVASAIIA